MRKQMVFLIGVLLIAPLFLVSIPDRDAPALHEVANSDHAALETRFNESEIVLANRLVNSAGKGGSWLLTARKDDNGEAGDAETEEEEKGDKGGGTPGFDRLWDVTCCG